MAIDDELKAQILRYHFVEHWRVGTIASQLGVHHSTVERVLGEAGVERERQRPRRPSKLDSYMAFITETLERFPTLSAARLFDMVKVRGYTGGPDHFRHVTAHLKHIEDVYMTDAYHSLSIEGYRVSPALIEAVRGGAWNPDRNEDHRAQRDALAARGYWQACQVVRGSVRRVLEGENPGTVAEEDHGAWYREMFAPGVAAGLVQPSESVTCRVPQRSRVHPALDARSAELGSGSRRDACVLRPPARRDRTVRSCRARALHVRLRSPLVGR